MEGLLGGHCRLWATSLFSIMDKVASWTIGAEANSVECSAELSLVLGVTGECAEVMTSVSKLALITIFAIAIFFKRPAELSLITRAVGLSFSLSVTTFHRFRLCTFQSPVQRGIHGRCLLGHL